jgi:hypothetical protein|tara:strand:+ start:2841 stop:3608 length:768 start_codon:yes stop_codon:yes gene_type:complete
MPSQKVLEWLNKTGFPLEMETASAFRAAGFEIRQSYSYPDPQSDKGREIDVLAIDPDLRGVIEISFIFECKSSKKPWVVLTSEDALANYNRLFAFAVTSEAARKSLASRLPKFGALDPYIARPSQGGYGFRQAFSENNDSAYAAAIGVIKACAGVARDRQESSIPCLAFAFPVIVVDSPLFECSLKNNGYLEIKEVEESEFLFSTHIPDHVGTCIRVIKKGQLKDFAQKAKTIADAIRSELKSDVDEAFKSFKNT